MLQKILFTQSVELLGAVCLRSLFSKNKYEHTSHDTKDDITRICPDWKSVSYATHKAEDAEAQ